VVVAVSGYYVNRDQAQRSLGTSKPDSSASTMAVLGRPPSSAPPTKIDVPPDSAQALGSGASSAAGVANKASTAPDASAESTNEVTAAKSDDVNTPTAQQQSVNDDRLAQRPVARTDPAQTSTQSAISADGAHETRQRASQSEAPPPSRQSAAPSSASTAALLQQKTIEPPSDAPRAGVCTDAVAALGFCNLKNNRAGNN
jgi:hypothetical protein